MIPLTSDSALGDRLFRLASHPEIRQTLYDRLGEYCHQCRNRLNSLKMGLYLARKQGSAETSAIWDRLEPLYLKLEQQIERVQDLCRPLRATPLRIDLGLLMNDRLPRWGSKWEQHGRRLIVRKPETQALASFDVELLGRWLDALVDWRAGEAHPSTTATLLWQADNQQAQLTWEETTQTEDSRKETSNRGIWVLPMIQRVAEVHAGTLRFQLEPAFRLELAWPSGVEQGLATVS